MLFVCTTAFRRAGTADDKKIKDEKIFLADEKTSGPDCR
jgi:hypothetical protein